MNIKTFLIHLWLWEPIYLLLPMAIYLHYGLLRKTDKKGLPLFISVINPFSSYKQIKTKVDKHDKTLLWLLVLITLIWIILGLIIKYFNF